MTNNIVCNPINIDYKYQFNQNMRKNNKIEIAREAADPSITLYKGIYYCFASMSLGVYSSMDLVTWQYQPLPKNLPLYDYAPDVRVIGDYLYFSASKKGEICHFYRTQNVIEGPYEEIQGTFDFWDPHLFEDEDGRIYFYWGCANTTPLYGIELDPKTMAPVGEKVGLIFGDVTVKGYERVGENHSIAPITGEALEARYQGFFAAQGMTEEGVPESMRPLIKGMLSNEPYIEGAWMNKIDGKYYLQYGCNGTQYNVYCDGVYVSDYPLGPYTLAKNNPYSYKVGGFIQGAGHGSTFIDLEDKMWHTATMSISVNHDFERRLGLWPAGIDEQGELFCNQRYGDWPMNIEALRQNPWRQPDWYLLSYQKTVTTSSSQDAYEPKYVVDENIRTWWTAANSQPGEWVKLDLHHPCQVHGIQINFADSELHLPVPGEIQGTTQARFIDDASHVTRWLLEGSLDDEQYEPIQDRVNDCTNLPHDWVVIEAGKEYRYLKLTILEVPYGVAPSISGIRVFGKGQGKLPSEANVNMERLGEVDVKISCQCPDAIGYMILWGHGPDQLYHSVMSFEQQTTLGALVKGENYYLRVDTFNEVGITEGQLCEMPKMV